ncbi:MAG: hypothetical protein P4L69_00160 [Desulfosporosinus sp.]|nr:hypothetical protein [Desulfosporosinus sp.]
MMLEQSQVQRKFTGKSWIVVGVLLSLTLIGVGGCGSPTTTSTPTAPATQSPPSSQANQGKTSKQANQNPALRAVMEIRRLQSNQQNALTTEQKDKIKPILQELISTSNPSQDILQQKADAINAVLTDQQKSFLTTRPNSQGNTQAGNNSTSNKANGNNSNGKKGTGNNQTGGSFNPQDMYQQVLDSLK